MTQENILQQIGKISPHAKEYIAQAFLKNEVEVLYEVGEKYNRGIFLKAENNESCIFYAYFSNKEQEKAALIIINEYLEKLAFNIKKEICFNVYGNNEKIVKLVQQKGFICDMHGYYMRFNNKPIEPIKANLLTVKNFNKNMLNKVVQLFDNAYYNLCIKNNWSTNDYTKNASFYFNEWQISAKNDEVKTFWLKNELIGAYIVKNNYITDIVVNPQFQNKGYGSYILKNCLNNMIKNKIKNITLRVTKNNTNAISLYEKCGFQKIAHFAEHTYL